MRDLDSIPIVDGNYNDSDEEDKITQPLTTPSPKPARRNIRRSILPVQTSPQIPLRSPNADTEELNVIPSLAAPSSVSPPLRAKQRQDSNSSQDSSKEDDGRLSAWMRELALKESRIGDIKLKLLNLRKELEEAEADLENFKRSAHQFTQQIPRPEKDSAVKKVVDGIGNQLWTFFDDVRSATMGIPDETDTDVRGRRETGTRTGERRLSPKKSIQNFMSRSPSPLNSARRQQLRMEKQEQVAEQRIRESKRLSTKLSHLDLRSPSPVRSK